MEEPPHVDMVYIPPRVPQAARAQPKPPLPKPPKQRKEPEPEPNAPPEATRATGTEVEQARPLAAGLPAKEPAPGATAPRPYAAPATLESEARRIFGRPRTTTPAGAGPQAIRPMEAYTPDSPERCIPRPAPPRDSAGPVQIGTVVGRIFRRDNGSPLVGAHLQMIGTPFVTFTDNQGEYRFRFDLALVDNCRTQYVRVTAPGYESRLLVLTVGPNARSEDVRLRHR